MSMAYHDVRYFNNNAKDARAAHAQRPKRYPSLAQCAHAFRLMSDNTIIDRRNRALFALWVMTGARAGALASFRIRHVDLVEGVIYQDAREVRTKGAKTFETWFFPWTRCIARPLRRGSPNSRKGISSDRATPCFPSKKSER